MVEERSLKVLSNNTTFFNKVSNTLTKLLIPTKIGINGMMINIKRTATVKAYEQLKTAEANNDVSKKEQFQNRYEESYTLYLESIDKHIMDSIYKKVKNNTASNYEKDALSNYYTIVHLKDNEYLEYKYRKQKFLLDLDHESLVVSGKDKVLNKYEPIYIEKIDTIYKGILKNYSVKLADGIRAKVVNQVDLYKKIFETLEDYIKNMLPIKIKIEGENKYSKILQEYDEYEKFSVGKLDEKDFLEKNMILLGLSRVLFTHSLPLVAAEQCYKKLLKDTRNLIVSTKAPEKRETTYKMLLELIEDYNVKLLSTKVYWDKPQEREAYKKFWDAYSKTGSSEEKEILSLKRELYETADEYEKYAEVRQFYKDKLVELGVMKKIKKSTCRTMKGFFTKL
ncbi:MAG: hypothetical protein IJW20_04260 [Clostridia bacterium]|nr:hypothetical protein [Clostridia bacterium]